MNAASTIDKPRFGRTSTCPTDLSVVPAVLPGEVGDWDNVRSWVWLQPHPGAKATTQRRPDNRQVRMIFLGTAILVLLIDNSTLKKAS